METLTALPRALDTSVSEPDPAMPDLGSLHEEAARFLHDAGRVIDRSLSRDSQGFLRAVRQTPAQ